MKFSSWLKEVLKDKDGTYSVNRPFYFVFMLAFIVAYFVLTAKKGRFPEIPASTFAFMGFLFSYEMGKKFFNLLQTITQSKKIFELHAGDEDM